MGTFYEIYKDHDQHTGWRDVSELATAKLPYALPSPAIVTHFPLFRTSHEDANFERHRKHFSRYLSEHRLTDFPVAITDQISTNQYLSDHRLNEFLLRAAFREIWEACLENLLNTELLHPELFVFNATTLINLELNRLTHGAIVKRQINRTPPWDNEGLRDCALGVTKDVLNAFLRTVEKFLEEFLTAHNKPNTIHPPESTPRADSDSGPTFAMRQLEFQDDLRPHIPYPTVGLGGFISWFESSDQLLKEDKILGISQADRKLFALSKPKFAPDTHEPLLDHYLLWRRGDRNWRYTVFEGISSYPYPAEADTEQCKSELAAFLQKLFSSRALQDSFPDLELDIFKENPNAIRYPLPGVRTAGAQYFVIPAELLLLLTQHIDDFAASYIPSSPQARPLPARVRKSALDTLIKLDLTTVRASRGDSDSGSAAKVQTLEEILKSSLPSASTLLHTAGIIRKRLSRLRTALIKRASSADGKGQQELETFNESFVVLAEVLWRTIYATQEFKLGYDDFVASTVIDGRAIYFSNFRPYEEIAFTRTFFIDFDLAPYQRGRLLRRLCEIATYRMSCVVDFARFQALQDGINTLNNKLNLLAVARLETSARSLDTINASLNKLSELYQRASQLNIFITEGVMGRKRAVEADWEHVKRQVSDIREGRLGKYARLSDFLERGLALSVIEIGLIADRYDNLSVRIRDHMATIRTDFNAFHALAIKEVMNRSLETLTHIDKLNDKLQENAVEHTRLLTGADLLVFIGGTYYVNGLLNDLVELIPGLSERGAIRAVVTVVTMAFSFLLVAWVHAKTTGRPVWKNVWAQMSRKAPSSRINSLPSS